MPNTKLQLPKDLVIQVLSFCKKEITHKVFPYINRLHKLIKQNKRLYPRYIKELDALVFIAESEISNYIAENEKAQHGYLAQAMLNYHTFYNTLFINIRPETVGDKELDKMYKLYNK